MNYTNKNEEYILSWLKQHLDEKRYKHSLSTAVCAKELAEKYEIDSQMAYIAGLLHDCAKCFPVEKLLSIINEHIKDVSEDEKQSYKTLHAPVSAYIAEIEFGVTNKQILSSIRWHTIGKIEMTNFEKIIFLADKIEPVTRKEEYRKKIEPALLFGLDSALLACYKETIKSLCDRDLRICPLTIDIYNNLENIIKLN